MSGTEESASPELSASIWEAAYQRFESPAQEIKKFERRLRFVGTGSWPRELDIVELFCGRGNGLVALEQLGFRNLEGVDLSTTLLSQYTGTARVHVGDCRCLEFEDASKDVMIVQGGLHHLLALPADLIQTLQETRRVLRPGGKILVIEPWQTPFLTLVHWASARRVLQKIYPKLEAFHTMCEHERPTYERWLLMPEEIQNLLQEFFVVELSKQAWGKIVFLGRKGQGSGVSDA